jgi:hypothetical protein
MILVLKWREITYFQLIAKKLLMSKFWQKMEEFKLNSLLKEMHSQTQIIEHSSEVELSMLFRMIHQKKRLWFRRKTTFNQLRLAKLNLLRDKSRIKNKKTSSSTKLLSKLKSSYSIQEHWPKLNLKSNKRLRMMPTISVRTLWTSKSSNIPRMISMISQHWLLKKLNKPMKIKCQSQKLLFKLMRLQRKKTFLSNFMTSNMAITEFI